MENPVETVSHGAVSLASLLPPIVEGGLEANLPAPAPSTIPPAAASSAAPTSQLRNTEVVCAGVDADAAVPPQWPDDPDPKTILLCSMHECVVGHRWPVQMATAACSGCGASILAVRMVQCPYCNEPIAKTTMRTDLIAKGMGIAPVCRGGESAGEVQMIELVRGFAEEVERAAGGIV